MIEKFSVSRDDGIYHAFPDVALTRGGRLVCVFLECTHHADRGYTRVMQCDSEDRGRSWTAKRPLSEALSGDPATHDWWNCPRVTALSDGRLVAVVDRLQGRDEGRLAEQRFCLWFSEDEGRSWEGPQVTELEGLVPDRLVELRQGPHAGRWLMSALAMESAPKLAGAPGFDLYAQRCYWSDDQGASWQGPVCVARDPELKLCEGSILELPGGELVCFMRENSFVGRDCYKAISRDGGESWEGPYAFPLPACHRPVAGRLRSGRVLITHRFMQGGKGWVGWWTQNLFAGLTDVESCLATRREEAHTRILPLDFDRSPESDTGYSGWVQFPDGEIYVVNYCLDDAPKGQIRGYALREADFLLEARPPA